MAYQIKRKVMEDYIPLSDKLERQLDEVENNIFFSKNKITAMERLKELQEEDDYYERFKGVKLSRKQYKHISGWSTWEFI
jgi:Mg2+ and Co2+ transporter CorA